MLTDRVRRILFVSMVAVSLWVFAGPIGPVILGLIVSKDSALPKVNADRIDLVQMDRFVKVMSVCQPQNAF